VAGVDGRPQGRDALALGSALAEALGVQLIATAVYPSTAHSPPDDLRAEAERNIADTLDSLAGGAEVRTQVVAAHSPARGLHDLAEEIHATCIVVGSSHRGALGRVLIGNVAIQLLSGSPAPVAVAPRGLADRGPITLGRIGVGFDDSAESWKALQQAALLAGSTGASVRVVHALTTLTTPPGPSYRAEDQQERRRAAEAATERAVASLPTTLNSESRVVAGDPVRVLEAEAHRDLDLLVLGSRAFGPVRRVVLGSVSSEIVRQAPGPVMVVPRSVEPASGGEAVTTREDVSAPS
jgi:nucleotide-binding universal stress UspA family protein